MEAPADILTNFFASKALLPSALLPFIRSFMAYALALEQATPEALGISTFCQGVGEVAVCDQRTGPVEAVFRRNAGSDIDDLESKVIFLLEDASCFGAQLSACAEETWLLVIVGGGNFNWLVFHQDHATDAVSQLSRDTE